MTWQQFLGITLMTIGAISFLRWAFRRGWDEAYELGWQHGRSEMEREQEERAEPAILIVHGGSVAPRRGRAVN